ncbi:MAG: transglutaminase-like domain-containing protein [candidate division WOR-3 bacterium]
MKRYIFLLLINFYIGLFSEQRIMDVFIGGKKIGYFIEEKTVLDNILKLEEKSKMKFKVYGNDVEIFSNSVSFFDKDWNIKKFFSGINSKDISFYMNGFVENEKLIIKTDLSGKDRTDTIDLKGKKIVFNIETIDKKILKENIFTFNPLNMKLEKIDIKFLGNESLEVLEKKVITSKYLLKTESSTFYLWFDNDNKCVKSSNDQGIEMVLAKKVEEPQEDFNILDYFKIEAKGNFRNIRKENYAKYIVDGIKDKNLSNYRQIHRKDTLEVFRRAISNRGFEDVNDSFYLLPDSSIILVANELFNKSKHDTLTFIKKSMEFVNKKLRKKIFSGLLTPSQILKNSYGDCTEHAQLFASILISKNVRVNVVSGIVFSEGEFLYHAWNNVFYKGTIYTVDPTFKQFEVDPSHIEISSGFPPQEVLLKNISGKIVIRRIK